MRERVLFIANAVILAFCLIASLGCCHDNAVMRHYNDVMREDMARIRQTQERQASEMRNNAPYSDGEYLHPGGQKMTKDEKKDEMKNRISMALKDPILQQGFEIICKNLVELEKENEQLRADYDKQKEINKELVDDIAELHKRIRELETQIKQANEREAQDIRARIPC